MSIQTQLIRLVIQKIILMTIEYKLPLFQLFLAHYTYYKYKINNRVTITDHSMSESIDGYNRMSNISAEEQANFVEQQDDAQFFSIAQQYNERKAKMMSFRAMEAMNMYHNFNIKNNPKDPKASQQKAQKTRKTRNDKQGREFTCGGCNLSYLSYPALYTHIKTKHGGVAPAGTIRGKNNNNKRRGRPKNLRSQPNLHHRPEPEFVFPKEYSKLVDKYEISFISSEELENLDNEENQDNQPPKLDSELFEQQIKQIKNQTLPLITLPIIKILTIYLYNINDILGNSRRDVMETVVSISEKLFTFMNKNYLKILTEFQSSSLYYIRKQIPENEIYCEYEKCDYVPVFVSQLFKKMDGINDQMEIDFLTDFCAWLHKKKLTYIKLVKPETLQAGSTLNQ